MTNIVSFPTGKKDEQELRDILREGEDLMERSRDLTLLISDWEDRFLHAGEIYLSKGGNDPKLVMLITTLKATRQILGIFL
jgi:hypothetical protein